jgi:hypothetical protein
MLSGGINFFTDFILSLIQYVEKLNLNSDETKFTQICR